MIKDFFKHPIVVGATVSIISLGIITPVVSFVKSISIKQSVVEIWKWIINIAAFPVKLWIPLVIFLAYLILKNIIIKIRSNEELHPYDVYRHDVVDEVNWEWNWSNTGSGYGIRKNNITPTCSECKGFLVVGDGNINRNGRIYSTAKYLVCENCNNEVKKLPEDSDKYLDKIIREIYRRVRVGEWKKNI